jgi:hypothetical protein
MKTGAQSLCRSEVVSRVSRLWLAQVYEKGSELAKQNIERVVQVPSGEQRDVSGHGNCDV